MSNSVIRMNTGDVVQVRTGILQGIGPQGPVGPVGPQGNTGPQGAQGVPGPMGQIDDFYSKVTSVGAPQSVASNTVTTLSFGTVVQDDASLVASVSNFALPIGIWDVHATLTFAKPSGGNASGYRRIETWFDGSLYEKFTLNCITAEDTCYSLNSFVVCVADGRILQVRCFHTDAVTLSVFGDVTFCRRGPGAQGPAGIQGPAGPPGALGPQGPLGPPGALVNNTTTFESIGG